MLHKIRQTSMVANMVSFSAAISTCEIGRHWEQTLALLPKMRQTSMTGNVISFTASISL